MQKQFREVEYIRNARVPRIATAIHPCILHPEIVDVIKSNRKSLPEGIIVSVSNKCATLTFSNGVGAFDAVEVYM